MTTEILMPALSPTMTEGRLAKWLKAKGILIYAVGVGVSSDSKTLLSSCATAFDRSK